MSIGENIIFLRREKGITQQELANQLFVTKQAVSRWEHGKRMPDIETIVRLAEVLDTDVNDLVR